MSLLEVEKLTKRFGGLVANGAVDMRVEEGEIVGLIGPNGAGKTTLFNCIAGFYRPDEGSVRFSGQEIAGLPPHRVCELGVARTFQIVKSFRGMTVLENVMAGAFLRTKSVARAQGVAAEALGLTGLAPKAGLRAGTLTIADMKRLELARALATRPRLLMLDEVMAGLTPKETKEAVELLQLIRGRGYTVLMVEHVMEVIMPISDRIIVLDAGRKIAEGRPAEIAEHEAVIKAYLGEKYDAQRERDNGRL